MSIQTDTLQSIRLENQFDFEKAQLKDQIAMLEAEIDRQSTIIDALIKAIKVIERG